MALNPGEVIVNRYKIVKKLGEGGFGAVYLAEDMHLRNKKVAIKQNTVTATDPALVRSVREQFEHEAATLANLSHPNLPRVTDFFVNPQGQFLIMDFISGTDLQDICIQKGQLSEAEILPIILQILDSLIYIHSQKPPVVHRDIKPANIRVREDGVAYLVDFGISKTTATLDGARAFSPHFSPPEQYGAGTDARSDIYALGATLYALLTGKVPTDSLARYSGAPFIAPRQINPSISTEIEKIILKAMAFQMGDRFQTAKELRAAIISVFSVIGGKSASVFHVQPLASAYVPQPKFSEAKSITVSPDGSSKYSTISDGIAAAGHGWTVRVHPGVYTENLIITKDINIQGYGSKRKIIIKAAGNQPAISVICGDFQLSNITIKATQKQPTCIEMSGGTSALSDCDLSGGDKTTLSVKDCVANMHSCSVHNSNGNGLAYAGQSAGVVEACRFYKNKNGGVQCTDASAPIFKQCKMYQNQSFGVACVSETKAIFNSCEMFDNYYSGVQCTDTSAPRFKQCKIYQNKLSFGIGCANETKAIFESCEIYENKTYGIYCSGAPSATFKNCIINQNQNRGVVCGDRSRPLFHDCNMIGNRDGNFWKADTSHPTLVRCQY